ncbi:serine/threonine-protein kinase fray2-like [Mya arenaria]|uniref:serine/threonine-protein kinase fray2-like n=1 Tax=Mya arenaria TaxID=6604 RepID=UPI0022E54A3C|nr:serine/threonine-protein kinase fray2-like [Mya arenaria]XP_052804582.1 serine/threonine-protein kinase fray2-like [Mya arenaria]
MTECVPKKPNIAEISPHLICALCGGYLIDATTIVECVHSFCKTCIVRYLESSKYCPICEVLVHKTKPLQNIRLDHTLQDIVYKLVPGLFQSEMRRRREFYKGYPTVRSAKTRQEQQGCRHIYTADESFSVALEFCPQGRVCRPSRRRSRSNDQCSSVPERRYLLCPAGTTIALLRKFLRLKFALDSNFQVDLVHVGGLVQDHYSLMDLAYIYSWKREGVIKLYYTIYRLPDPVPEIIITEVKDELTTNDADDKVCKADDTRPSSLFSKAALLGNNTMDRNLAHDLSPLELIATVANDISSFQESRGLKRKTEAAQLYENDDDNSSTETQIKRTVERAIDLCSNNNSSGANDSTSTSNSSLSFRTDSNNTKNVSSDSFGSNSSTLNPCSRASNSPVTKVSPAASNQPTVQKSEHEKPMKTDTASQCDPRPKKPRLESQNKSNQHSKVGKSERPTTDNKAPNKNVEPAITPDTLKHKSSSNKDSELVQKVDMSKSNTKLSKVSTTKTDSSKVTSSVSKTSASALNALSFLTEKLKTNVQRASLSKQSIKDSNSVDKSSSDSKKEISVSKIGDKVPFESINSKSTSSTLDSKSPSKKPSDLKRPLEKRPLFKKSSDSKPNTQTKILDVRPTDVDAKKMSKPDTDVIKKTGANSDANGNKQVETSIRLEESRNGDEKAMISPSTVTDTSKDTSNNKDTSKDTSKNKDTSKDNFKTKETSKDISKNKDTSKEILKTKVTSKDTSKAKDTSKDTSKVIDTSKETSKIKDTGKDTSKTKDTTKDISKTKYTSKDISKNKDTSKDISKTKDTSKDISKTKDTSKDISQNKDTSKDIMKNKDTGKDTAKTKDTSKDISKNKDMSKDILKIKDTSKEFSKTKDSSKDNSKTKDTSRDSSKSKDKSKDTVKIIDASKDTSKTKETSKDSSKNKDTSEDSSKNKDLGKDYSKTKDTSKDTSKNKASGKVTSNDGKQLNGHSSPAELAKVQQK